MRGTMAGAGARVEAPITPGAALSLATGVFADSGGQLALRDTLLAAGFTPIREPTAVLRVRPGVWLPTGSAVTGLEATVLTTGSLDPALSADLTVGGAWIGLFGMSGRLPVYAGADHVRQGAFGRLDARLARRVGGGAVAVGASVAGQVDRGAPLDGFTELAALATAVVPLDTRTALEAGLRVPVWTGLRDPTYRAALQLGLTRVIDLKRER